MCRQPSLSYLTPHNRVAVLKDFLDSGRMHAVLDYLNLLIANGNIHKDMASIAIDIFSRQRLWYRVLLCYELTSDSFPSLGLESHIQVINAFISVGDFSGAEKLIAISNELHPKSTHLIDRSKRLLEAQGNHKGAALLLYNHIINDSPSKSRSVSSLRSLLLLHDHISSIFSVSDLYLRFKDIILCEPGLISSFLILMIISSEFATAYDLLLYSLENLSRMEDNSLVSQLIHELVAEKHKNKASYSEWSSFILYLSTELNTYKRDLVVTFLFDFIFVDDPVLRNKLSRLDLLAGKEPLEFPVSQGKTRESTSNDGPQARKITNFADSCDFLSRNLDTILIDRKEISAIFCKTLSSGSFFRAANLDRSSRILKRLIRFLIFKKALFSSLRMEYAVGCAYSLLLSEWNTYYPLRHIVKHELLAKSYDVYIIMDKLQYIINTKSRTAEDELSDLWPFMLANLLFRNNIPFNFIIHSDIVDKDLYITFPPSPIATAAIDISLYLQARGIFLESLNSNNVNSTTDRRNIICAARIRHINSCLFKSSPLVVGSSSYMSRNLATFQSALDLYRDNDISISPRFYPRSLSLKLHKKHFLTIPEHDSVIINSDKLKHSLLAVNPCNLINDQYENHLHRIFSNAFTLLLNSNVSSVHLGEGFCIESQALAVASNLLGKGDVNIWPHSFNPSYFVDFHDHLHIAHYHVCSNSGAAFIKNSSIRADPRPIGKTLDLKSIEHDNFSECELNIIIIGNDTSSSFSPLLDWREYIQLTQEVTRQLSRIKNSRTYFKSKNNSSSSLSAFKTVASDDLQISLIKSRLSDIHLPNAIFLSIGIASNALLEGIAMGYPALYVPCDSSLQYIVYEPKCIEALDVDSVYDKINLLRDPSQLSSLLLLQQNAMLADYS